MIKEEIKICEVVMISTENKNHIGLWLLPTTVLKYGTINDAGVGKPQHLYVLSDDKIEEGDWYIDDTNQIRKAVNSDKDWQNSGKLGYIICKKIVATTDKSIKQCQCRQKEHKMSCKLQWCLPSIPKSFIEEFVKSDGKIKEIRVEYEISQEWLKENPPFSAPYPDVEYVIKTNNENEIVIRCI